MFFRRSAVDYSVVTNGPLPVANSLAVVGEEGKIVLMPGDAIVAVVDVGTIDVIASYLEQA